MTTIPNKIDRDVETAINWLLENDQVVTARSVAAKAGVAPSTITRSAVRSQAVIKAAGEQARLMAIVASNKSSREALLVIVDQRNKTIADLERKIMILAASHRAMLMAVGEMGGVAGWRKFFAKHEEIRQELLRLQAMPASLEGEL